MPLNKIYHSQIHCIKTFPVIKFRKVQNINFDQKWEKKRTKNTCLKAQNLIRSRSHEALFDILLSNTLYRNFYCNQAHRSQKYQFWPTITKNSPKIHVWKPKFLSGPDLMRLHKIYHSQIYCIKTFPVIKLTRV